MTTSDSEHANADLHTRTRDDSTLHRLFDSRVCTARVAHTGNACIDRILQIIHGIEKAHREWCDNIAGNVHTFEHDVNMRVDEPRQDVSTARIDFSDLSIRQANAICMTD